MSTENDRSTVLIFLVMLLVSAIVITLWEGWKFNSEKRTADRSEDRRKARSMRFVFQELRGHLPVDEVH